MYCVKIDNNELNDFHISLFVDQLQVNCLGDIVSIDLMPYKPVIVYPKLHITNSRMHLKWNNNNIGYNVIKYLRTLTIVVTHKCELNCSYCCNIYKQFTTCYKSKESDMQLEIIKNLLDRLYMHSLSRVNLIGGNVFLYSDYDKLCELIKANTFIEFCMYINYNNVIHVDSRLLKKISNFSNLKVIVQVADDFIESGFENVCRLFENFSIIFSFEFLVGSELFYYNIESLCEKFSLTNLSIRPIISEKSDFNNSIFITEDNIFSKVYSKKDIFRRQSLNLFDFGKLFIDSNSDVYANVNIPVLGNLKVSSIEELLTFEMEGGKSWFRIRDEAPCNNCIYQWLCPSPSNYEIILNKNNLCKIKS
jgi:pseudo-rSAM protein